MKKVLLYVIILLSVTTLTAQVGINTNDPKTTLDVVGNPSNAAMPDGVIAPKITRAQLIAKTAYTTNQIGAMVYVTDLSGTTNAATNNVQQIGYYYYDGSIWKTMNAATFTFGDIKTGMQSIDHNGWVKLDGRAKSSLTATQQTQATALGISSSLPDATNAFLVQNGSAVGTVAGSSTKTITQANLPNVTLTGSTNSAGSHTHTIPFVASAINLSWHTTGGGGAGYLINGNTTTSSSDSHGHTLTTSSLNGNVTQTTFDVTPKTLSVNTFIYLGY